MCRAAPLALSNFGRVNAQNIAGLPLVVLGGRPERFRAVSEFGDPPRWWREWYRQQDRMVGGALVGDISGAGPLHFKMVTGEITPDDIVKPDTNGVFQGYLEASGAEANRSFLSCEREFRLIIHQEICVGCGSCQPYCPAGAIGFADLVSAVDQDKCYECGTCLRVAVCPVDAIAESDAVQDYPRALRKYFSDATTTHAVTGIEGRGTEESKTNDITGRVGPGDVGVAIEVGRPTVGMDLKDIQKITRALARAGITEIEPQNPIHSMISDPANG